MPIFGSLFTKTNPKVKIAQTQVQEYKAAVDAYIQLFDSIAKSDDPTQLIAKNNSIITLGTHCESKLFELKNSKLNNQFNAAQQEFNKRDIKNLHGGIFIKSTSSDSAPEYRN